MKIMKIKNHKNMLAIGSIDSQELNALIKTGIFPELCLKILEQKLGEDPGYYYDLTVDLDDVCMLDEEDYDYNDEQNAPCELCLSKQKNFWVRLIPEEYYYKPDEEWLIKEVKIEII